MRCKTLVTTSDLKASKHVCVVVYRDGVKFLKIFPEKITSREDEGAETRGYQPPTPCPLPSTKKQIQSGKPKMFLKNLHCQIFHYGHYFNKLSEAGNLIKKQMHNFQALQLVKFKPAVSYIKTLTMFGTCRLYCYLII